MKIISIEGSDGVGKSTQSKIIAGKLIEQGFKVYFEHFPRYDAPIGELIGDILKGKHKMPSFDAMQMLYAADQTDFKNKLDELEKEGYDYVILDRYFLSTIVYYCTKINDYTNLPTVVGWQTGIPKPDITMVLTSEKVITQKEKYKELDVFEQDEKFMKALNKGYTHMAKVLRHEMPMELVYANDSIDNVANKIYRKLKENFII